MADEVLGLIAGEGMFPLIVARGARGMGRKVVCAGLGGCVWPEVRGECDVFKEVGVLRVGQWVRYFRGQGVRQVIMVGRVRKGEMYSRWRYLQYIPDVRTLRVWFTRLRHDKRDHAVLLAVCEELASEGIELIDSTTYSKEELATAGVMTRRQPTEKQWEDIRFGWEMCRTISSMDIGQAMAVIDKDVIAVEAVEGTNAMIERAGRYCRSGGWTLIKVANAKQDMRMDVPTVGTTTIEKLKEARGGCLVLDVGKTILLEKAKVLELADRLGIAVVGWGEAVQVSGFRVQGEK
ncbi:MAG TPA: UDP-2,3-diacylglucosamine diphosphatase LpxI [Tepidisphaeraceae bacterium]|nr:UDP-2,3-diacylglucosamine diphosphatase LpxI [Tepidisphaeraceae bacterium]